MDIVFRNIIPQNIKDEYIFNSSIWDTNITFKQNQFYLIRSVSGRGKTTLINYLSGKRTDYLGIQLHNEDDCKNLKAEGWIQKRKNEIALVNQDLKLVNGLTVFENLLLKLELTNYINITKIDDYLKALNIIDLKNKNCSILSMGQLQRVAIVRSLLQPFHWLLLDEPFSHLDQKNTENALTLITNAAKEQKAGIILTSLNLKEEIDLFKTIDL